MKNISELSHVDIVRISGHVQTLKDKKTKDDKPVLVHNGPHHDAKWARDLLNTPSQAEYKRLRVNGLV